MSFGILAWMDRQASNSITQACFGLFMLVLVVAFVHAVGILYLSYDLVVLWWAWCGGRWHGMVCGVVGQVCCTAVVV